MPRRCATLSFAGLLIFACSRRTGPQELAPRPEAGCSAVQVGSDRMLWSRREKPVRHSSTEDHAGTLAYLAPSEPFGVLAWTDGGLVEHRRGPLRNAPARPTGG